MFVSGFKNDGLRIDVLGFISSLGIAMSTTPLKPLDLQEISQVLNLQSTSEVNRHISLGWVLLGLSSNQYSEHGYTLVYHLGWQRSLGELQRAESDIETWLKDDSTPF